MKKVSLKILFPFVGNSIGGSHKSAVILMKGLSKYGIDAIALVHKNGILKELLLSEKIKLIETNLPIWEDKKSAFLNFIQLFLITPFIIFKLRSLNIDLVHINDGRIKNSWSIATKVLNKKLIVHQRTIFDNSRLSYLLYHLPNHIISISDFVKESMPKRFFKKIRVITNPFEKKMIINKKDARNQICKRLKINSKDYIFSIIGTINFQKRPLIALKAISLLKKKGINATIIFAGKISEKNKKYLENEIKKQNMTNNALIVGFQVDINKFLYGSDFILAPAINEGHGRVLIEAMLSKTAVIASDHGGHKEIIKNNYNGILTKPDCYQDLAKKILMLIDNKIEYQNLVKNAKYYAEKKYGVSNHVNSIIEIYNS